MTGLRWWQATSLKPGVPLTMMARQFSLPDIKFLVIIYNLRSIEIPPSELLGCPLLQRCWEVVAPLGQLTLLAPWFTRPPVQK